MKTKNIVKLRYSFVLLQYYSCNQLKGGSHAFCLLFIYNFNLEQNLQIF